METTEPMNELQAVESLLAPVEAPEQEIVEESAEAEEVEAIEEPESEELEAASEEFDEDEGDDEGFEDELEDHEEEAPEQPQVYTVKVDGVDTEVTLEELTQSYSGQKYIQKGMQEAAEQKKQAEAVFNALQQEQARLAQLYQTMQQGGVMSAPVKPDAKMAQEDPIGYISAMAEYDAQKEIFDQQQAQFSQATQQQTQAQRQAMQVYVSEQKQILKRDIPEFADAQKGRQLQQDIRSMGERFGFSNEELSAISDARVVKVLHSALKWEQLQANKGKVEKKAKKARPVTKPKAPRKTNAKAKQQQEARKRLEQSGSVQDAVNLLMGN